MTLAMAAKLTTRYYKWIIVYVIIIKSNTSYYLWLFIKILHRQNYASIKIQYATLLKSMFPPGLNFMDKLFSRFKFCFLFIFLTIAFSLCFLPNKWNYKQYAKEVTPFLNVLYTLFFKLTEYILNSLCSV